MSRTPIYLRGHLVDNYDGYIIDAKYIKDGYQVVGTLKDRDLLPKRFPINITIGSRVHVRETTKDYRYAGDNQWLEIAEGGGGGTGDYGDLINKPTIDGVELRKGSTHSELGLLGIQDKEELKTSITELQKEKADTKLLDLYQKKLTAGAHITIDPVTNTISADGGGGTLVNVIGSSYIGVLKSVVEGTDTYQVYINQSLIVPDIIKGSAALITSGGVYDFKEEINKALEGKQDHSTLDADVAALGYIKEGGSGDYGDLENKPTIDGVELRKGSTHSELGLLGTQDKEEILNKLPKTYITDLTPVDSSTIRWHDQNGDLHSWSPAIEGGITEIKLNGEVVSVKEGTAELENIARQSDVDTAINNLKDTKQDNLTEENAGLNITIETDPVTGKAKINAHTERVYHHHVKVFKQWNKSAGDPAHTVRRPSIMLLLNLTSSKSEKVTSVQELIQAIYDHMQTVGLEWLDISCTGSIVYRTNDSWDGDLVQIDLFGLKVEDATKFKFLTGTRGLTSDTVGSYLPSDPYISTDFEKNVYIVTDDVI